MSSGLSHGISMLVSRARFEGIHDHDAIKELTMVAGYAHLVESHPHPQYWRQIRKHLQAFVDRTCTGGHRELCADSAKLMVMLDDAEEKDAA